MKIELCQNDFEAPDVFEQKFPTAKKEYKCCECGQTINPGEKYESAFGVWSGEARRFKRCPICVKTIDFIYGGVCPYQGLDEMLWNDLALETIDDLPGIPQDIIPRIEKYLYKNNEEEE